MIFLSFACGACSMGMPGSRNFLLSPFGAACYFFGSSTRNLTPMLRNFEAMGSKCSLCSFKCFAISLCNARSLMSSARRWRESTFSASVLPAITARREKHEGFPRHK